MNRETRNKLIRLAHNKPEFRSRLLPLLSQKAASSIPKMEDGGSIEEAIEAKLWRCLRVALSNTGALTPASKSTVPMKSGRLEFTAYALEGKARSGKWVGLTVIIQQGGRSGGYTIEFYEGHGLGSIAEDQRASGKSLLLKTVNKPFAFNKKLSEVSKEISSTINSELSKL